MTVIDNQQGNASTPEAIDRREFLQSTATVGAGLMLSPAVLAQSEPGKVDDINVALIGLGDQCGRLMDAILGSKMAKTEGIKGIRFKAVCDIYPYRLQQIAGRLRKAYKHDVSAYKSYKEMLAKEKDLDAAIIATPDWLHAPMTIACLEAGLHVYCEKEMSNNLQEAGKMVQTAKRTGKLLQIGHQRRSNPRYQAAERLIREHKLLGKLLNINAQWNRSVKKHRVPVPPNKKIWVDEAALKGHGYESMEQLMNWRWYKKFGAGPLGDLGSHQIDVFNWFLGGANPKSVMASGSNDYYKFEHNENVMAIYDYQTEQGSVRAFYQVLNTTAWGTYGTYYETFMGDVGTLLISERVWGKNKNIGWAFLEEHIADDPAVRKRWNDCIAKKLIGSEYKMTKDTKDKSVLKIGASIPGQKAFRYHPLLTKLTEPVHQPHLKNFFDAIRSNGKIGLNCPGEVGYETAVAVLKANEAIEKGEILRFAPEEFKV
ncbi:MAG: Gfo/Idh/MocA family protein [Planctomycetota bacterium]